MKKLTFAQKLKIIYLHYSDENYFYLYAQGDYSMPVKVDASKRTHQGVIQKEWEKIEKIAADKRYLEVINDTSAFRAESELIDHGYSGWTGSNYDKMLVRFCGEEYVINDKEKYITKYNGLNF